MNVFEKIIFALSVTWLFSALPVFANCVGAETLGVKLNGAEEASIRFENDGFLLFGASDNGYTQGLIYETRCFGDRYIQDDDNEPQYYESAQFSGLVTSDQVRFKTNVGFNFGQLIFTPSDLNEPGIIEDDRPYAGWLFIGAFYETYVSDGTYTKLSLAFGCIGPCSYAEEIQIIGHRIFSNSPRPLGWHNQITNEPGVVASYEKRRTLLFNSLEGEDVFSYSYDAAYRMKANLGNIFDDLSYGMIFRLGLIEPYFVSPTFAGPDQAPGKLSDSSSGVGRLREWFFDLRLNAVFTLYDATLSGSMFMDDDPHTVDSSALVLDGKFGLTFTWDRLLLRSSIGFNSPESPVTSGVSFFGAIETTYRW